jgi:prepilin-type N-terminal cleavage/methylation domain-containing protein
MTYNSTRRLAGAAGYSLIELLVAMSIFGIIALAGLPHIDRRREDLNTSVQRVMADMRFARARSITSGEHYAIEWTGANQYELQRLVVNSAGEWELDRVERTVVLPEHIEFTLPEEADERFEFNTRGMMVSSTQPLWPTLSDVIRDVDRTFSVWPSGQIFMEE